MRTDDESGFVKEIANSLANELENAADPDRHADLQTDYDDVDELGRCGAWLGEDADVPSVAPSALYPVGSTTFRAKGAEYIIRGTGLASPPLAPYVTDTYEVQALQPETVDRDYIGIPIDDFHYHVEVGNVEILDTDAYPYSDPDIADPSWGRCGICECPIDDMWSASVGRCRDCAESVEDGDHSFRLRHSPDFVRDVGVDAEGVVEVECTDRSFTPGNFRSLARSGEAHELSVVFDMDSVPEGESVVYPRVGEVCELEYLVVGSPEETTTVRFEITDVETVEIPGVEGMETPHGEITGVIRTLTAVGSGVSR